MAPMGVVWRVLVAMAGFAFGIASIRVAYPIWNGVGWLGDLLTGWALIVVGLIGASRPAGRRTGALAMLAGFAWFLGDWASYAGTTGVVAGVATFLHRGIVFQAILTAPHGRAKSSVERIATAVGYAASLVPPIWTNVWTASAASLLAVGTSAALVGRAPVLLRAPKRRAFEACALMFGAVIAGFLIRTVWDGPTSTQIALLVYEMALVGTAIMLVSASRLPERAGLGADLVVELGTAPGGSLEQVLRSALGDPAIRLGYPSGRPGAFRDGRGGRLDAAAEDVRVVDSDGQPVAALEVAPGTLDDPRLLASVSAAVRLDSANRALRIDVARQIDAVRASQRRILRTADEESRLIAERLEAGTGARLGELASAIEEALAQATSEATRTGLEHARSALAQARDDLDDLTRGLHPRVLTEHGLDAALAAVALDAPIRVSLSVDAGLELPFETELAVYYFCLEALTNVVKHAKATSASITVRQERDALRVEITDDGVGGASPSRGVGLRGASDRITALHGTVEVRSRWNEGTRLRAELPTARSANGRASPTGVP